MCAGVGRPLLDLSANRDPCAHLVVSDQTLQAALAPQPGIMVSLWGRGVIQGL